MIESITQFLRARENQMNISYYINTLLVYTDKLKRIKYIPSISNKFIQLFNNELVVVSNYITKNSDNEYLVEEFCKDKNYKLIDHYEVKFYAIIDSIKHLFFIDTCSSDIDLATSKFADWKNALQQFDIECEMETRFIHGIPRLIENIDRLEENYDQYRNYIHKEYKELEPTDIITLKSVLIQEYKKLNKNYDYPWSPYRFHNDIILIESPHQEPWGILHMDANFEIETYPTISHYIYSRLFKDRDIQSSIRGMSHLESMKKSCEENYRYVLEKIQYRALKRAYEELYSTNQDFKKFLNQTGQLECETKSGLFDMSIQILNTIKQDFSNHSKEIFTASDYISPVYKREFQIDGKTYFSIIEYIYYNYFVYFGKSDYPKTNLEQTFAQYQEEFFKQIVQDSAIKAYNSKKENLEFRKLLKASPKFNVLETGFLAKYTNFYCNQTLDMIRCELEEMNLNVIDMSKLLDEPVIRDWIVMNRLPDLIENINLICTYLKRDLDPDLLKTILDKFYYTVCGCDEMIIYHPPNNFINLLNAIPSLQEMSGYKTIYLIWYYISILLYLVYKNSVHIFDMMKNIPTTYTKEDIYIALRSLIYGLNSLCIEKFNRFTISVDELNLIKNILKIQLPIDKTFKKVDYELFHRIQTDLKHLQLPENKFTDICISIYIYTESIYSMMDSLTMKTKSRIYFYC